MCFDRFLPDAFLTRWHFLRHTSKIELDEQAEKFQRPEERKKCSQPGCSFVAKNNWSLKNHFKSHKEDRVRFFTFYNEGFFRFLLDTKCFLIVSIDNSIIKDQL